MSQLEFLAPSSIDDAISALARAGGAGRALSGGTDLIVQMRARRLAPSVVVDLKRIPGLSGVKETADGFEIGAATSGAELGEHAALLRAWPGVVEAANLIGSTQVQSRATLAGNLCNASPAADSVPALIAAGAVCVIAGPSGRREAPVETIPTAPGRTSLAPGEIVIAIKLPKRPARSGDAYLRSIPRTEMDIAIVGAGVSVTLDASGAITAARVALGAVGPTAVLAGAAGVAIVGSRLEAAALDALDAAARAAAKPISDKRGTADYRTKTAGVLARRAAQIAYARATEQA